MRFGYYPVLFIGLVLVLGFLYRVSLPRPLPTHRLLLGSVLAAVVFLVATVGLRLYLTWITATGYTYGALATPIAFLLFAFFLGFAIMLGRRAERRRPGGVARPRHPRPSTARLDRGAGRVAQGVPDRDGQRRGPQGRACRHRRAGRQGPAGRYFLSDS